MSRTLQMRAWTDDDLVVDNFAGGGGASTGLAEALESSPDIAINHDPEAIALHKANHPDTKHYCEDVWHVDPIAATAGRRVRAGWFSPDCKDFSKAKGGKPVSKKIRGLAVLVLRWAGLLIANGQDLDCVFLENVEEFLGWGPLLANGKRDPARLGEYFRALVAAMQDGLAADHPAMAEFREFLGADFPYQLLVKGLGYDVQWRELRGCDYGAPTTRKRLFLIARRDGHAIVWPEPTHGRGRARPYRVAAECIDWSLPGESIFDRESRGKKPLVEKTLARIARGLRRFVVESPEPFLVTYYGTKEIGAERGASLRHPLPTVTTENRFGLVTPFLVPRYGERSGQEPRTRSVELPMPTIVPTGNGAQLVSAFLAKHYGDRGQRPGCGMDEPLSTITVDDHHAVVASYLLKYKGTCRDGQPLTEPLGTVQASGTHHAQVCAFLIAYYGNERDGGALTEPIRTISTKDRFALITIAGTEYVIIDIRMRMLTARELFNGQGFPATYIIDAPYIDEQGRRRQMSETAAKRMCGNAVNPDVASAIVRANLPPRAQRQERAA